VEAVGTWFYVSSDIFLSFLTGGWMCVRFDSVLHLKLPRYRLKELGIGYCESTDD
jgi:uncharacterized ferritin-like protein (DUF455 family)